MDKASQVYKKIKHIPTGQAINMLTHEFMNRKPIEGLGIPYTKYRVPFEKIGGILDPKRDKMDPDIWTSGQRLKPNIRKHIMNVAMSFIPKESIKQVVVLGSLTGLQYKDTSDLDVNVLVYPERLVEELWDERRKYNDKIIPGTKHTLNIYLQAYKDEIKIPTYQDSYFGVYDVLHNRWLVKPPPASSYRRPQDKFWAELISARMLANEFIRKADNYTRSINNRKILMNSKCMCSPWKLSTAEARVVKDLNSLLIFLDDLEAERNFAYGLGWGVPRVGYRNILYKFIHKWLPSKYKTILENVEEIKHKSNKENGSSS